MVDASNCSICSQCVNDVKSLQSAIDGQRKVIRQPGRETKIKSQHLNKRNEKLVDRKEKKSFFVRRAGEKRNRSNFLFRLGANKKKLRAIYFSLFEKRSKETN